MARVTADLTQVKTIQALPKDIYIGRVETCLAEMSKKQPDGTGGNPMLNLTWLVEETAEGDRTCAGRKIPFDRVVYGGLSKKREPIVPYGFAKLLECLKVSWSCAHCGVGGARDFLHGTGENGIEKGSIVCPDCKQPMMVEVDTDEIVGSRCKIAVDVRKNDGDDREFNEVKGYAPLD